MPQFLIDHLEGCRPTKPCASCVTLSFLKSKLKPDDYERFLKLLEQCTGVTVEGPHNPAVNLDTPWEKALGEMSFRTRMCLKNERLITLADVVRRTAAEHARMPNFGRKSLKELEELLAAIGLRLGMDVPETPQEQTSARTTE